MKLTSCIKSLIVSVLLVTATPSFSKTVKVVVPFAPGGATSVLAKAWVDQINKSIDKKDDLTLQIDYRPGTAGIVGVQHVVNSDTDDVVLLITSNQIVINPFLHSGVGQVGKELQGVAFAGTSTMVLLVGKDSKINNVLELKELQKLRKVTIGHSGVGSGNWLASIALSKALNIDYQLVGYKGNSPALVDVIGGHIDGMVDFLSTSTQHIQAGNVRPILVLSDTRPKEIEQPVQTFKELTGASFPTPIWWGIFSNQTKDTVTLSKVKSAIAAAYSDKEFIAATAATGINIHQLDFNRFLIDQSEQVKLFLNSKEVTR